MFFRNLDVCIVGIIVSKGNYKIYWLENGKIAQLTFAFSIWQRDHCNFDQVLTWLLNDSYKMVVIEIFFGQLGPAETHAGVNKKPNQLNFRPCWVLTKLIPGHVAKCEFPYVTGRNFHKIILLIFYCCEWKRYEIEAHMGLRFEFLPSRVLDLKKRISRWTFMIFFNSSNYCLWILLIFIWYDEEVEKVW